MQSHGQYQRADALVTGIHQANGFHPGYRAVHALGRIYRGVFTASGDGAALTRAAHLQPGSVVLATMRFSSAASDPEAPPSPVTAMATKFYLDNGTVTDLIALNIPAFPMATPDDVLRVVTANKDPETRRAFFAGNPGIARAIQALAAVPAPRSLAETAFHAIHTFWFENDARERRAVRYHWEPEAGVSTQPAAELSAQPNDVLFAELESRLTDGPVMFRLVVSLAQEVDDLLDPSTAWPQDRERVVLGRLAVQRRTSLEEIGDPIMMHDPTRTTDGIDTSDDPILAARRGIYETSAVNRGAGWKSRAAEAARKAGAS